MKRKCKVWILRRDVWEFKQWDAEGPIDSIIPSDDNMYSVEVEAESKREAFALAYRQWKGVVLPPYYLDEILDEPIDTPAIRFYVDENGRLVAGMPQGSP